jgi:hypothetical protein
LKETPEAGSSMKNFPRCCRIERPGASYFRKRLPWFLLLVFCLGPISTAVCQVEPSAKGGGSWLDAGGMFSASHLNYGSRNLLGATAFVDFKLNHRYGVEGEMTWLFLHQQENVHDETFLVGPRFNFNSIGRWQPYAKVLAGNGQFNFPFSYAHGGYLVIAGGGGVSYRLTHKVSLRVADVEYQYWPQFTFGSLSSIGINSGIQYRIR